MGGEKGNLSLGLRGVIVWCGCRFADVVAVGEVGWARAAFSAALLRPRFLGAGVLVGIVSAGSERLVAASRRRMTGSKKRMWCLARLSSS